MLSHLDPSGQLYSQAMVSQIKRYGILVKTVISDDLVNPLSEPPFMFCSPRKKQVLSMAKYMAQQAATISDNNGALARHCQVD